MIMECSTLGSCSSRNIFNSNLNKNYKDFFHINYSIETVSLISLMSIPLEVDEDLIHVDDSFEKSCIYNDVSKKFLEFLKKDEIDYLIMDTYVDAVFGIVILNENQYLTDSYCLKKTKLYNQFNEKRKINILNHFEEYFNLWKIACDSFFEFINKNCKSIKVVLNCSRSVFRYYDGQNIVINDEFKNELIHEKSRNTFDKYILENYDVEVLSFDYNTLADMDHIFGPHPTHYESKYYEDKTNQLNRIINRNNFLESDDKLNQDFRKICRDYNSIKLDCSALKNSITYK